jgi:very-short-patch-repair endonuclease/GNAT superfamily N-acetyltransferase
MILEQRNLEEFGYRLPPTKSYGGRHKKKFYKIWAKYDCCKTDVLIAWAQYERTRKKNGGLYVCPRCKAQSEEGRKQRSKQSKRAWSNPDYQKKQSEIQSKIANSEEGKRQRSEQSKNAWTNEEYRDNALVIIRERFRSDEHRKLVSERNKQAYEKDPEKYLREKVAPLHTKEARKKHKEALAKPEYKELHSRLARKRFEDPEYRARHLQSVQSEKYKHKISKSLERQGDKGFKSRLERVVASILEQLGFDFTSQKAVGPYNFDFYLVKKNLFIEVQGEYWHSLPKNQQRDAAKFTYLEKARPSSTILYLNENEFFNPGVIKQKIVRAVYGSKSPISINTFNFDQVMINTVETKKARIFLNSWHYAQFGRNAKKLFGAFVDDILIAVCKFSPPSRKEVATSIGLKNRAVVELDRFCIRPDYQRKNLASWFISRAVRLLFNELDTLQAIITFADSTYGHSGVIYKASGWQLLSTVKPDYYYVGKDGWIVHKKTLYNHARSMKQTERDYADNNGYTKVKGKEKFKFAIYRRDIISS